MLTLAPTLTPMLATLQNPAVDLITRLRPRHCCHNCTAWQCSEQRSAHRAGMRPCNRPACNPPCCIPCSRDACLQACMLSKQLPLFVHQRGSCSPVVNNAAELLHSSLCQRRVSGMYRPGISDPRLGCRHSEALACFTFRPTRQDDAKRQAVACVSNKDSV